MSTLQISMARVRRRTKVAKNKESVEDKPKPVEAKAQNLPGVQNPIKKKKNKGQKKKFLKLEAKAAELGVTLDSLLPKTEDEMLKRLEGGHFRYINEQLYMKTSKEAKKMFEEDPSAFDQYHAGYRDQAKKWPLNPVNVIIQQLNKRKELVIADMGCGDAKVAECLGHNNTVHSFDLVSKKPNVVACDMSHVPLEKGTCDVVIFCLSLMGTNTNEFLREAHRILKTDGVLKIAEVCSRFGNVRAFMRGVGKMGFEFVRSKTMQDYFVLFDFKKVGKIEHKRPTGLELKPCMYKKR